MGMTDYIFTSESVTEGHPDKVADQISDAVLDAIIAQDKNARVACETMVTTGMAFVSGEITTNCYVDIPAIVRQTIKEIGYCDSAMGFDWETCGVISAIGRQSVDISQGVSEGEGLYKEQGAGDQGLMFGYACDETPELMPLPIHLAHALTRKLAEVRKNGTLPWLRPDGKSQVSIQYVDNKPVRVDSIVVAAQHAPEISHEKIQEGIIEEVVKKSIQSGLMDKNTKHYINATGRFVVGGPMGDCGLTGRKIIVDTYGGVGCHGGGAFSGKDPSKVDRSGSYMARCVAKTVVAAGLANECEVQFAYAIGYPEPVSVNVNTYGTAKVETNKIAKAILQIFDLRPSAMIKELDLLRPIYKQTAAYGHFGREEPDFTWERTDKVEELLKAFGIKSSGCKSMSNACCS